MTTRMGRIRNIHFVGIGGAGMAGGPVGAGGGWGDHRRTEPAVAAGDVRIVARGPVEVKGDSDSTLSKPGLSALCQPADAEPGEHDLLVPVLLEQAANLLTRQRDQRRVRARARVGVRQSRSGSAAKQHGRPTAHGWRSTARGR